MGVVLVLLVLGDKVAQAAIGDGLWKVEQIRNDPRGFCESALKDFMAATAQIQATTNKLAELIKDELKRVLKKMFDELAARFNDTTRLAKLELEGEEAEKLAAQCDSIVNNIAQHRADLFSDSWIALNPLLLPTTAVSVDWSNLVGSGSFGYIFEGTLKDGDKSSIRVAVKWLHKLLSPRAMESIFLECEALRYRQDYFKYPFLFFAHHSAT